MARRKVRDQDEAVELLEALEASGQSLADFSRTRGLDGRSLQCWKRNLQRSLEPAPRSLHLVEVTRAAPPRTLYRIVVDGIEVEVDDHFRDDTLARLLAVVVAC